MISNARVLSIRDLSPSTKEYFLQLDLSFHHEPGQFLQLTLEKVDPSMIWPESRSFSIASYELPNNQIRLIIKKEGYYTTRIFNETKVNSILTVKLPYGNFLPPFDMSKSLCLAGGTGIAPFLAFFDFYKTNGFISNFNLYHSVKFKEEAVDKVLLSKELKNNYKLFITKETVQNTINRRISLEDISSNFSKETKIFICGNKSFNEYFKTNLNLIGYNNIILENW